MPDGIHSLVRKLREGLEYDYYGNAVSPDYVMEVAADALEAAYDVITEDK